MATTTTSQRKLAKPKKPAPTVRVWGSGLVGLWTPSGSIDLPKNYIDVPTGSAGLTRAIKLACAASRSAKVVYLRMSKTRKNYPSQIVGIVAPQRIVERVEAQWIAAQEDREAARVKAAEARKRREERDQAETVAELLRRYPGCPEHEAESIVRHAFEVGSGRVGRSSTADDPIKAAVVAHIRHMHTDYNELLEDGMDRYEARDAVYEQVGDIMRKWQSGEDPTSDDD